MSWLLKEASYKQNAMRMGRVAPTTPCLWHLLLSHAWRPPWTCRACSEGTSTSALCKYLASQRLYRDCGLCSQTRHPASSTWPQCCLPSVVPEGSLKTSTTASTAGLSATARHVGHCHLCPRQE